MKIKLIVGSLLILLLLVGCQTQSETAQIINFDREEASLQKDASNAKSPIAETASGEINSSTTLIQEEDEIPPAPIENDEGGPVSITGDVNYTNAFFTMGVAEPVVILEDQAGFVDRNENFLMPIESQTLGQITSDFFQSPFTYSVALPIEPKGSLRDVDNDGEEDEGIQTFAIAYWTNTFGDPYLEERDLFGGGWSTAYASTLTGNDGEDRREIIGGKLLIFAPDDGQAFPTGFGDDGYLFTEDDPLVTVPQGYTIVDLDTAPFSFDRSRHPVIHLLEPESSALVDYSDLNYVDAFNSLIDKLSNEYAFTEYKDLDWEEIRAALLPEFENAAAEEDTLLYRRGLRNLAWSIPDGHVSGPQLIEDFLDDTSGGLGIAVRELDDGRIIVNFLVPGSPAAEAGIEIGAEILEMDGRPTAEVVSEVVPHSSPFSTEHFKRLQQLRYVTRSPLGSDIELSYKNPESDTSETVSLTSVQEPDSFRFSSLNIGRDGFELPVDYELMPESGYAIVEISSFSDNELLTIQLWERLMRELNENAVPGLIIDMRMNTGGSGFLADQMAAYFYDEPLILGNTGRYDEELDDFFFDPRGEEKFYPPAEELRYHGPVAVLIGPNCNSACEFFTYDMTLEDRAAIVGQYPTAGLGGSIDTIKMPEGEFFTFTKGRAVDAAGEIHIEGKGVPPTIQVPVNEETLFSTGDPVLETAINHLNQTLQPDYEQTSEIFVGDEITADLTPDTRHQYLLTVSEGDFIDLTVASGDFDPVLLILDELGNILLANDNLSDDTTDAGFAGLEIPLDMTLLLDIAGLEEDQGGEYTFTILRSES